MGQNGVGKTTLLRMLAGTLNSDNQAKLPQNITVSYKPQRIAPRFQVIHFYGSADVSGYY